LTTASATLEDARLDETFAALANSTRRAILAHLTDGEASVNDLPAPFDRMGRLTVPLPGYRTGS
jgi:DNA-binding transcriptional ArsR family regulator